MTPATPMPRGRPYRSHRQPACVPCRRRKCRCISGSSPSSCVMCEVHGTQCTYPESGGSASGRARHSTSRARNRFQHHVREGESQFHLSSSPNYGTDNYLMSPITDVPGIATQPATEDPGTLSDTDDHNVHIVGPVMANDTEVLETYFGTLPKSGWKRRYNSIRVARPVMFTPMSKKPLGLDRPQMLSSSKCEIIQKLIEPHAQDLIQMYLQHANICLPIFDQSIFLDMYVNKRDNISPALLANLYANSLTYWSVSSSTPSRHVPDRLFVWAQASEALLSESFWSPGTSTVIALILNVSGRPSTSPFHNGGMIGTAIALAHALGFNRDPSKWRISEVEKDMRLRLWWQLVVQDRWCSWSYGTPPQIRAAHCDVPLPGLQVIRRSLQSENHEAAAVSLALLSLTEVLGHLLEYVYDVKNTAKTLDPEQSSMLLETQLSTWESNQQGSVEQIIRHGVRLDISGAANLRLSYLATRLLLRRIQLDLNEHSQEPLNSSPTTYHHYRALQAAEDIAWLVEVLEEPHIRGFWQGQNSATLTSAMSFLLRSAVQSFSNGETIRGNASLDKAVQMMETLRSLQSRYSWDIADSCIAQYGGFMDHVVTMRYSETSLDNNSGDQQSFNFLPNLEEAIAQLADVDTMGLDLMFPSLWDMGDI